MVACLASSISTSRCRGGRDLADDDRLGGAVPEAEAEPPRWPWLAAPLRAGGPHRKPQQLHGGRQQLRETDLRALRLQPPGHRRSRPGTTQRQSSVTSSPSGAVTISGKLCISVIGHRMTNLEVDLERLVEAT